MRAPPVRPGGLAAGALAAIVTLAYGVATDLVRVPATSGVPFGEVLVAATLAVVPFAVGGAAALALRHRVVLPLAAAGVFAVLPALLGWHADTGAPATLPPAVDLTLTLWYAIGASLVLVGLAVALNRRFDLLAPLVGLVAYLLVDLAYLQPLVAEGSELVVVLLLAVWPLLSTAFAGAGAVEWWVRDRRGEYDEPEDGGDEGSDGGGLALEGGLFGDRV